MPRIELPDGHHADMRGEDELVDADVEAMLALMQTDEGPGTMVMKMARALAVQMIISWTLVTAEDGPLPATPETFARLPWTVSMPMRSHVAPMIQKIMGDMAPDPKSAAPSSPSAVTG